MTVGYLEESSAAAATEAGEKRYILVSKCGWVENLLDRRRVRLLALAADIIDHLGSDLAVGAQFFPH
jgi:hypothetical protein